MNFILWIFVNLIGFLVCATLLAGISSNKTNNFIEKIPKLARWLLTPIFGIVCMALCEAVLRFFTEGMSIFWSAGDTQSNIFITGYTLIPMMGMYGLCWGCYLMAPKYKIYTVAFFGASLLMLNFLIFVALDFSLASDVIVERITQSENASTFSSIIALVFYSLGLLMGLKSAGRDSFWSVVK